MVSAPCGELRPTKDKECPERSEPRVSTICILMPYYFYLARCADDSLYCGSCKDLAVREATHNAGKGARYTRSRRPVHMVYSEEFSTLIQAMRREAQVKTWSKIKKENLAAGNIQRKIDVQCTMGT